MIRKAEVARRRARRAASLRGATAGACATPTPDAVPVRPASVAGAPGARSRRSDAFARGPARARGGRLHAGRPLRLVGRRRPDAPTRSPRGRRVARGDPRRRRAAVRRRTATAISCSATRFAAATGATLLPELARRRSSAACPRCCATATSCAPTTSTTSATARACAIPATQRAPAAPALLRPPRASPAWLRRKSRNAKALKPESIMDVDDAAPSPTRFARIGVDAHDPRPHASSGAARACGRRHDARAHRAAPTGTTAAATSRSTRTASRARDRRARLGARRRVGPISARARRRRRARIESDPRFLAQRLREVADQVVRSSMPTETRISESAMPIAARRSRAHLVEDRVRDGDRERAVVAEVRRQHDDLAAGSGTSNGSMPSASSNESSAAVAAEQLARERVLRVRRRARDSGPRARADAPRATAASASAFAHWRSIRSASVSAPTAMWCACSAASVPPKSRRPFLRIC